MTDAPPTEPPPKRVREPAQGNRFVRALGWALGVAVMLGTAVIVILAVTMRDEAPLAAVKPPRQCPPSVSVPVRALGQPVDDVMGVRPGMNARDFEEIVKCVAEDYVVEARALTNGVANTGRKSRPLVQARRGQDTVTAALFGPEGQEQAAVIWREVYFDAGEGPPPAQVEAMFVAQYGSPHEARDNPQGVRLLTWTYAPDGRALRKKPADGDIAGAVAYMAAGWTVAACVNNLRTDPEAAPIWDGRCGLTIRAEIDPNLSDRTRTARWRVTLLDQATLARQAPPLRAMGAAAPP